MKIDITLRRGRSIRLEGSAIVLPISVAVAFFVGGGATGYAVTADGLHAMPSPSRAASSPGPATPNPAAPITISSPADGSAVGKCLVVSGTGAVPAGEALVVVDQEQADDQRYFEKDVSINPAAGTWSANVVVGQDSESRAVFTIYAILVDKALADYLSTTQTYNDASSTWWASPQWPTGSDVAAQIAVHRFAVDHC
jgi:hypothetical protein